MVRVTIINALERDMKINTIVKALIKCKEKNKEVNKEHLILYIMEKYNCMRRTALEYFKVAEYRFKNAK